MILSGLDLYKGLDKSPNQIAAKMSSVEKVKRKQPLTKAQRRENNKRQQEVERKEIVELEKRIQAEAPPKGVHAC